MSSPASDNHTSPEAGLQPRSVRVLSWRRELQQIRLAAAKERFVARLRSSSLKSLVIRPTAFFSDMAEILALARRAPVFLFGDGCARINPISGRDLAEAAVGSLLGGEPELNIGGPQTLTHEEIAKLAFEALQKPPRIWHLPRWMAPATARILRAVTPVQEYGPVEFLLTVATQDMVAPPKVTTCWESLPK